MGRATTTSLKNNKKPKARVQPPVEAELDLVRQLSIFDPTKFAEERIDVIGVGAVGSHVAWFLAKTGFKNIHVWDDDIVASHNVPNQQFFLDQVGQTKVAALAENIMRATGVMVAMHPVKFIGQEGLGKHVFLGVDSMEARKSIFDLSIRMKLGIETMFETRIGSDICRIYLISPISPAQIRGWEETLYLDSEAEVSLCGTVPSIITTSSLAAAAAVWQFIKWLSSRDVENELVIGFRPAFNVLTRKFI